MLFLTTRVTDFDKLTEKTAGNPYVEAMTLQALEAQSEEENIDIARFLSGFQCVVVDEAHYFTTDSGFNQGSILSYEALRGFADGIAAGSGKTLVLLSATPEGLWKIFPAAEMRFPADTSGIGKIVFVPAAEYESSIAALIMQAARRGEKGIAFFGSIADMAKCKTILDMHKAGDMVMMLSAKKTRIKPDEYGSFHIPSDKTFILTTSVLSYGVDFCDGDIKYMCSNDTDPVLVAQSLARRRTAPGEKITYYIADHEPGTLSQIYTAAAAKKREFDLYMTDRQAYLDARAAGGKWAVRSIDENPCMYTDRTMQGNRRPHIPYIAYCERLAGYSQEVQGGKTWRELVIPRLGFKSPTFAPIADYDTEIIEADVIRALEELYKNPAATVEDWQRIGIALRLPVTKVVTKGRTYRYGEFLSRPSAISKHIEKYGYKAGAAKAKRIDGKVIRIYPLEKIQ